MNYNIPINFINSYKKSKNINGRINSILEILYTDEYEKCIYCNIEYKENNNYFYCDNCGIVSNLLINDEYIEPQERITKYPYKQKEHFKYKLMKLQGNDNEIIPDYVINTLKKYKNDYNTIHELQQIMKKYKYREYFKNIIIIDYKIKGKLIHNLDTNLFNNLMDSFNDIQKAYYKFINRNKQLFNYNYIIFKLCFLYNRIDIARNIFFIRKYDATIKRYDNIWEFICNENGYPFEDTKTQIKKCLQYNIF